MRQSSPSGMMIVSAGVTSAVDAIIGQCHINVTVYTVYVLSACLAVLMYTE